MLKFGIISEVYPEKGLARVYFEEDDFVSAPLKISVMRSGPDQISFPFDIKETVWCVMDENCEHGVIGGAYYDDTNKPAGSAKGKLVINFADNSTIEYDRESHILKFDIKGDINVSCEQLTAECSGKAEITATDVDITAATTKITGILEVTGAATIKGMALVGGLGSATPGVPIPTEAGTELNIEKITATTVEASGDVKAGAVSLKTHKHTYPPGSSGGTTSTPIP